LAALLVPGLGAELALADGTPDITASVSSSSTLYGDPVHVAVSATNPKTEPYGYNLSFRAVLPEGVSYAGGAPVAPQEIADAPNDGETTLIFENVSDLSPGATKEFSFDLQYSQTTFDAGDSFPVKVQAFVNEDPRYIPKFNAEGIPQDEPTSFTGFTQELSGTQTLKAIQVEIEEPSREGEIIRGVHEHQTVYTLKVRNNGVNPTTGTTLDAYLPAGLEFLGCAGTPDHTSDSPTTGTPEEWPGSGPIVVESVAGCVPPQSVETELADPDGPGPMPEAIYTHVVFPVGELKDGETKAFPFRAAVPLRANEEFSGAKPSGTSLEQAANLDNNSGPEVVDETLLRTYAKAEGTYQGKTPGPAADEEINERTAEDWVVYKEGSSGVLAQGQITTWTLTFRTSEYKFVEGATVTDTLPSGLCPLGPENFTADDNPECEKVVGQGPSVPYAAKPVENPDGTWTLTWDGNSLAKLAHSGISDEFQITFPSKTRTHYWENGAEAGPILTHDRIDNEVTTAGAGMARCTAPGAANCEPAGPKIYGNDGPTITDASHAEQVAGAAVIEKQIAASGANCETATYTDEVPHYKPGDIVCWKLRVDFPGALDTTPQALADFLPEGTEYIAGSDTPTGSNDVSATIDESAAAEGLLTWTVTGSTVPAGGEVFEHTIKTRVKPVGSPLNGDLVGNLFKFSSENTNEESFPQRDEAEFVLDTPELSLVKGVARVNGQPAPNGNPPDTDGVEVHGGDNVEYRIDIANEGDADAWNVAIRDQLEDGITCSDVKIVSHTGGCSGNRVEWAENFIAAGATETFAYVVEIPTGVEPGKRIDDHAGVVSYQSTTNEEPINGFFTYHPANNIDPTAPEANAPAADDTSWVHTPGPSFTKTAVTGVEEAGNNLATQATIGETIEYTAKFVQPEGTTIGGVQFSDHLEPGRYEFLTANVSLNGSAWPSPGSIALDPGGGIEASFSGSHTNPTGSGSDIWELTISGRVLDVAANSRVAPNQTLTNTAHFDWTGEGSAEHHETAGVSTEIVEPNITVTKSDDGPDNRVSPGDVVTYTVGATDASGTRVSTAHEVVIEDQVPEGLIPVGVAPGNVPLADGEEVPGSGGATWDEDTRTITKEIGDLSPAAGSSFSYRAEVEKPAVAGSTLTNEAEATATSLDEGTPNRRTGGSGYEAATKDTVRLTGAAITKEVSPDEATPGDPLAYRLTVTIPANVELFDTTVVDHLPAGVEFDAYASEQCLSGCPLVNPINRYTPAPGAGGVETIAWDLGDIPALSEPQVIEFTYDAHLLVENRTIGGEVERGDTEVNSATISSDLSDEQGAFNPGSIPTEFDETSEAAEATVTAAEPELTIDKQIKVGNGAFGPGPVTAHSDDQLGYEVVVENKGDSPAYDVEVVDQLDPALTGVQVVPQAGVFSLIDEPAHELTFHIDGPIAPGDAVTVEYSAELIVAAQLHDGEAVPNTASIPLYYGVSEADREVNPSWEFREYEDGSDSAEAILDFPALELEKTTGLASNPDTGTAEVGQDFPWRIVVGNGSATAGAKAVHVADTLPPNWTYTEGSTKFDGVAAPDPGVTPNPSGDELEWTVPAVAAGANVVITFDARPTVAAETSPGTGAEANENVAEVVSAEDEAGNSGDEEGPYGAGPDAATATLAVPNLTIEKTPDGGSAVAGEGSAFEVTVENSGDAPARNVVVTDVLPAGLAYEANSATSNPDDGFSETSVAPGPGAGETEVVWHYPSLGAGEAVTITVPVKLAATLSDGATLVNEAGVVSDELPNPVGDEGSLEVETEADVLIEKNGDPAYTPGDEYTWHLHVENKGPSEARNVVVADPLPSGTSLVATDSPCAEAAADEVECDLGDLAVGFAHTYDVTVEVDPSTETSPLDNTATVTTDTEDPEPGNEESTFGPTAGSLADVWVEKSAEPEAILRKHEAAFTMVIGNEGPSTARAVKLEDPVPGGLEVLSVDAPCDHAGQLVTCEFGDMLPHEERTVHVTVKGAVNGPHLNTATVETTTAEPSGGGRPNSDTAQVEVGPVADLAIEKTAPPTVAADGQLTWTLKVTNNGEDDATGVTVTDPLPAGVVFASADPGCTLASGTVSCEIGVLADGESSERHLTVTVPRALADTTIVNTARVEGDQGDDEPANDESEAATTVGPSADVSIQKTGPARVNADGTMTWTLAVSNAGPSTATGVTVKDALPAGVELSSATPSQGSCSTGATVECQLGTLAKGASAQVQIAVHVPPALEGSTLVNKATVGSEQPDPDPGNNESGARTVVDPPAPSDYDLAIAKTVEGSAKPNVGDAVRYSLAVVNRGPATATGVKILDTLPGGLEFVSATVPGGQCSSGSAVTCKVASLKAGQDVRATVTARVTQAGTLRNTASVSAAVADADPSNNRSSVKVQALLRPAKVTVTKKRIGHGPVAMGERVRFQIKVRNLGDNLASGVVVCDRLPAAMSVARLAGAELQRGEACWQIDTLAGGATKTYRLTTRIDGGAGGMVRNVAWVKGQNAPKRQGVAGVHVESAGPGRSGGVTG
jgi:uncharacterized repeat protein (TIGR01451 family)/fimbrial isopeptide formation D2 family protein